ncbi:hypothetical protein AB0E96_00110 [Kitasatospora sp. NPDC036755]|uniref:hypothetical protein n=1 Tax=Kitasatospora sp. NPDC036755 TaxID=3154600 RepID=UPI0033C0B3FB
MTHYIEVASAEGAWTQTLHLPTALPVQRVRHVLTGLARTWPVAAFLPGTADEPVNEVVLYRDPSRTYGTPDTSACDAAVHRLVATTGWTRGAGRGDDAAIVGLGLREGYDAGAREHSPGEVTGHLLSTSATGWRCRVARLVSARLVDHSVRWYAENGVVVRAESRLLPAVGAAARNCAQHRYVVTNLVEQRTYVFQRSPDGGSPT